MKQLLEIIPLILFFATYHLYGVREAAIVLVSATVIQMFLLHFKFGGIEKQQKIMAIAIIFFGALTIYFNELKFLKWKATLVYGFFALALLMSQVVFKKPLIKTLLAKEISLPEKVWNTINLGWSLFFFICMLINIYISTQLSDDAWATFRVFIVMGMTIIATIITGIYLYKHLPKEEMQHSNNKSQE